MAHTSSVLLALFAAAALNQSDPDPARTQRLLDEAVHFCSVPRLQAAVEAGADPKTISYDQLGDVVWRASRVPGEAVWGNCFALLKALLEAGVDPNIVVASAYPLNRAEGPNAKPVIEALRKAGAIDFDKEIPDCDAAKARLKEARPAVRTYVRYKLLNKCHEWELVGGHYVAADVARIRSAPSASASIVMLKRINARVIVDERSDGWARLDKVGWGPLGWVKEEALRKTPTTPEEARAALEKAMAESNTALTVTWADRLRALSPAEPSDLQRVIAAYTAAGEKTKEKSAAQALAGNAPVYLAVCEHDMARLVATVSRGEGLRPLKGSPRALAQWVGAAGWFSVQERGNVPSKAAPDTHSEHQEERIESYDENSVTEPEHVTLRGACVGYTFVTATAPFTRVTGGDAGKETIELALGDATFRLSFASATRKPGRKTEQKLVRVVHDAEGGATVEVVLATDKKY